MSRRLLKSRWVTILIIVVVIGAWGWVLQQQMEALRQYPWEIAPLALVVATLAGSIYFTGLGWSWALLLRTMVSSPIKVSPVAATRVWLISMITRYIPGNIWHILGRLAFAERLQVRKTQVLASGAIEQVLTLLGALVVCLFTLPFWRVLPAESLWVSWLLPFGLIVLHPQLMGRALRWTANRFQRPELIWDYTFTDILRLLLLFTAANGFSGLGLCILLSGLTPIALADWPFLIGAACLAWIIGYVSILTPSGLGVREAALTALLVLLYPVPVAVAASLLFRVVLTIGEAIAAAIAWFAHQHATTEVARSS